jgi:hypothetical protein
MANSKLLKEAIADAKAVKETALANAKLALEEAFTPRLQSILAAKMQAEAEVEDGEEMANEELNSSDIGTADHSGKNPGKMPNLNAGTDLSVGVKKDGGKPEQAGTDYKKVADINEDEENPFATDDSMGDDKDAKIAELESRIAELEGGNQMHDEPDADNAGGESDYDADNADHMSADDEMGKKDDFGHDKQDDMDLEAIIRELEAQLQGDEEGHEGEEQEDEMYETYHDGSEAGTDKSEDPKVVTANEMEDPTKASGKAPRGSFDKDSISEEVIDLEEILREMEADMKDDSEEDKKDENVQAELNEAYKVIKSLQTTINEVNLLNAKLLFANKLFRAHNMTNEQKVKVIETLDRTNSVREVKLVYSTLAENFKYTSTTATSVKKSITEGIASKVTKSTKPAETKQVIAENTVISDRFQKLAGIIK